MMRSFLFAMMLFGMYSFADASFTKSMEAKADVSFVSATDNDGSASADSLCDVRAWVITFTSITTIHAPISKAEARKLEKSGQDEPFALEVDGEYFAVSHEMVETGKVVVKDSKFVSMLNDAVRKEGFEEYREDVTVKDGVAYARWYDGNRGGGFSEDFPEEIVKYVEALRFDGSTESDD